MPDFDEKEFLEILGLIDSGKLKLYQIEDYLIKKMDPEAEDKAKNKYELEKEVWNELSKNWEIACNKGALYRQTIFGGNQDLSLLKTEGSFFNLAPINLRIENPVGTAKVGVFEIIPSIPIVGVPAKFQGDREHADGEYKPWLAVGNETLLPIYIGSKALIKAEKNIESIVTKDGITRSIILKTDGLKEADELKGWISKNYDKIEGIVYDSDKWHNCKLLDMEIFQVGSALYVRLIANTGDAMGMNMLTQASDLVGGWIKEQTQEQYGTLFLTVSGNLDTDKKNTAINHTKGRGKTVSSRVVLTDEDLEVCGTTARELFNYTRRKDWDRRHLPARMRCDHALDVISGYFVHGQDLAQTVESSHCQKYTYLIDGHTIEYTIELPSLEIATFGGGSNTPSAQKYLDLIGCKGEGKAIKLAEIIAGTVLAAEFGQDIYDITNEAAPCKGWINIVVTNSDTAEIPVGVAGPIDKKVSGFEEDYQVLLGTTETALVGAVNAGIKAINKHKENFKIETKLVEEKDDGSKVFDIYTELRIPSSYFETDKKNPANSLGMVNLISSKCWGGSGKAGGYFGSENTNVANSIAALNAAYGQPLNLIKPNAQASMMAELAENGDLIFKLSLPNVQLNTSVTNPYTIQALETIDCYGKGKEEKLAKIYGITATALELRTTWTQAAGTLARAHTDMTKG